MKKINLIPIIILVLITNISSAQNINWRSIGKTNYIAHVNLGWDYSFSTGIAVGYKFKTTFPLMANASFSMPAGDDLADDFKTKLGLQAELLRINNFSVTGKVAGIFRKYKSSIATMKNFGGEFTLVSGYYRPKWYAAAEGNLDKAIITHIKHSDLAKEMRPGVQDGWFIPTGGNLSYGVAGGYTFRKNEVSLRLGKVVTQDWKTTPLVPYYFQVGYTRYL